MKASELIRLLTQIIDRDGDLDVMVYPNTGAQNYDVPYSPYVDDWTAPATKRIVIEAQS